MELKPTNNIEQLFKQGFEDFQPDVDPKVWTNIQQTISKSGNGTATWFGSLAGKLILGSAAVTLVTVSVILLSGNHNQTPVKKNDLPSNTTAQTITTTTDNSVKQPDNTTITPNTNTTVTKKQPVNTTPDTHIVTNDGNKTSVNTTPNEPKNDNVTQTPVNPEKNTTEPNVIPNITPKNPVQEPIVNNPPDPTTTTVVNKQPIAVIEMSPSGSGTSAPVTISFTNKGRAINHEWNFGDGSFTSYEKTPMHIFEYAGEYTVTLIATNEAGKTERDSVRIKIASNGFFIPNTFTPNGDGNNDTYKIIKNDSYPFEVTNLEIVVFDRTNQKVAAFYSTDYAWDGRSITNGQMCPQGTYLVVVKYTSTEDGKSHEQRGALFLKE